MQLDLPSVRTDHGGGDAVAHYCSQAHPNLERTKCWIRISGTTRNYLGSQKLGITKILYNKLHLISKYDIITIITECLLPSLKK